MEFGRNDPNPLTADGGIETHPYKFQGIHYDRSQPSFTWSFPSKMSCNETCATIVTWKPRPTTSDGMDRDMNFPAASGLMPRFCWRCMPLARKQLLQTGQNEILTWQRICKRSSAVSNHKSYWVHAFQGHQLLCVYRNINDIMHIFAEYVLYSYIVLCGD